MDERGWTRPSPAALADAERLLALVGRGREPLVEVEPDGAVSLSWESGRRGWVTLAVRGDGQVSHAAVIDEDEYALAEPFGPELPPWAAEVLARLLGPEH